MHFHFIYKGGLVMYPLLPEQGNGNSIKLSLKAWFLFCLAKKSY